MFYHRKTMTTTTTTNNDSSTPSNAPFELTSLLPPPPPPRSPPSPRNLPFGTDCHQVLPTEIRPERLRFGQVLGHGQFGNVYEGELKPFEGVDRNEAIQVAIKTLADECGPKRRSEFTRDVMSTSRLQHDNVVELLGVLLSNGQPNAVVFDYSFHGDLHELLLLRAPSIEQVNDRDAGVLVDRERTDLDHGDFLHIAVQISNGMEYLSSMQYVHRDLATRSCLVTDHLAIRIGNFGLVRDEHRGDYLQTPQRTLLPIRWMSPEALMFASFSQMSDVWAFGVTLWEIYSYGRQPYQGYGNSEVIDLIRSRNLLECPKNCSARIYSLMVECWHENPMRRPRFCELHARLQTWSLVSSSSPVQSTATISLPYKNGGQNVARSLSVHSGSSTAAPPGGRCSRQSCSRPPGPPNLVPSPAPLSSNYNNNNNNNNDSNNGAYHLNIGRHNNHHNHNHRRNVKTINRAVEVANTRQAYNNYSEDGDSDD